MGNAFPCACHRERALLSAGARSRRIPSGNPSPEPTLAYPRLAAADDLVFDDAPAVGFALPRPLHGLRVEVDAVRVLNVAAALVLLALAAPVMLLVALLVKLTSPG